jgi:hypothetical protein
MIFLSHIADILSIVGFVLTMVGLGITIWQLLQIKRVANAANLAANEAKNSIRKHDSIIEISSLISELKFITQEHLKKDLDPQSLYSNYTQVRQRASVLRSLQSNLSDDQNIVIQNLLSQIKIIQTGIEKSNNSSKPVDVRKANSILLEIVVELSVIAVSLRNE